MAGDPLRPLVYPRIPLSATSTLSYNINPQEKVSVTFPHWPTFFADAELAGCIATRYTYYCTLIMVGGTAVSMSIKKCMAGHTTDSETKAQYEALKKLIPTRKLFDVMGTPCPGPSPGFCDNKAVGDIVLSGKMTARCRHNDIPIAFLHAHHHATYQHHFVPGDRMLADIGTKANTPAEHRRFKYWVSGARFLPTSPDSDHYKLLQMQFYEKNYLSFIGDLSSS